MNTSESNSLQIVKWWKFWENPLVIRYQRSQLRLKKSLGWILAVSLLSVFLFFTIFLGAVNNDFATPKEAARAVLVPLVIIQGILMMLMGTGNVASGIVQDKVNGTIDYQRLTPMTPLSKIVGYLFGLPIKEYLLFAITIPFTIAALAIGQIPFDVWLPVYTIFFTSVLLYHFTGMAAGMIAKKWRFAARMTQGLVILLYLVLPQFSHLGLYAFQYLTVRPVLMAKLSPLLPNVPGGSGANPLMDTSETVPFFVWEFSSFSFSLVLQSLLIITLGVMCYRKWRDEHQHALSKRFGIGVFAVIAVMILGNLWPILTRDTSVSIPIFGAMSANRIDQGVGVSLPIILCLAMMGVAIAVLNMVTPAYHEVLKGWRRVLKQGQPRLSIFANEAPSGFVVIVIGAIAVCAILIEMVTLNANNFYDKYSLDWLSYVYLPLAFCVALGSFYTSLIGLQTRRIFLIILLGWIFPGMIAIFLGAAFNMFDVAAYVAALSPLFLIIFGGGFLMPPEVAVDSDFTVSTVRNAFWLSCVLHTVWIIWISRKWNKQYQELIELAKSGSKEIPSSLLESQED